MRMCVGKYQTIVICVLLYICFILHVAGLSFMKAVVYSTQTVNKNGKMSYLINHKYAVSYNSKYS